MFTGDRSGDFLYKALYRAGFANQASSISRDDGLALNNAYISATVRCAPPANKPLPSELVNCKPYFERELKLIRPSAVLALGGIAMRAYLLLLKQQGAIARPGAFTFRHGASHDLGPNLPRLFVSYHPSQQNTFTGKLTEAMLANVFARYPEIPGKESCDMSAHSEADLRRDAIIEFRDAAYRLGKRATSCLVAKL